MVETQLLLYFHSIVSVEAQTQLPKFSLCSPPSFRRSLVFICIVTTNTLEQLNIYYCRHKYLFSLYVGEGHSIQEINYIR